MNHGSSTLGGATAPEVAGADTDVTFLFSPRSSISSLSPSYIYIYIYIYIDYMNEEKLTEIDTL